MEVINTMMVPKNVNKSSKTNRTNGNKKKNSTLFENEEKNDEDKSILRQPIDIGIRGVKDLMKALAGGTTELQDLLLNECSVIYECKICCNLFRSLANFISHKRVYCVKSFCYFTNSFNSFQNDGQSPPSIKQNDVMVIPDTPPQNEQLMNDTESWVTSDKVCESESGQIDGVIPFAPRKKLDPIKITKKRDITEIVAGLNQRGNKEVGEMKDDVPGSIFNSENGDSIKLRKNACHKAVVELENVNDSNSSVFQTLKRQDYEHSNDSMKIQLIELDRVVSKNQAILQENGKFMVTSQSVETEEERNLEKHNCSFCDSSFLTEQTLSRHIQIYHRERICYPCPLCRTFFASPSSVYRHLSKAHHRTEQQIRRLRPQVFAKARKRKLLQASPKVIPSIYDDSRRSKREADDWINNFEGVLRCNGCGKLFNRRAVLSVHSASCRKRAALLNAPASETTNKVKSNPQTIKLPLKQVLPLKNSKPMIAKQLPKSGIIIRKDYCKTVGNAEGPLISSLLTEVDKRCSWGGKSWRLVVGGDSRVSNNESGPISKSNCSNRISPSSNSNSDSMSGSSKTSNVNKKLNSFDKLELPRKSNEKGGRNFEDAPAQVQDVPVKN